MARSIARLKMGYYPLPEREGAKLCTLLVFNGPASVVDPCAGQGTALNLLTQGANVRRYGVELDAERALASKASGIQTTQGNAFDAAVKPESFSLLYLNPPYDSEIGSIANRRMEALFLEHTYRWLVMEGVLVLVIPFERLQDCAGILSSHFARLTVLRMTDEDSVQYRQIAVLGLRRDVRGAAVESNKRQLLSIGLYGSFLGLPELKPGACPPYSVPPSGEAELSYRGLPYDLLEDLLPQSGAWKQAAPLLMPHEDVATGRPITPLHGGHVGLLCTAGLLNGVFGQGDDRHIAHWRSVKHVTTFVEQDGDTEIIHHRERWANELYLVYADGRTLKLTETPAKKEDEADGECTPAVRAA
jgi:Uncharacterised methyltransferase family (DUF6094)